MTKYKREENRFGRSYQKTGGIVSFLLKRKWIFAILFATVLAGLSCKWYAGPGHAWFNNYGAGVVYEIFWCVFVFLFLPRKEAALTIAVGVFLVTSLLEIMQLWHPWFLQQVRSTFLGKALLGTTFVWWDFPHYAVGCFLGWLLMRTLLLRLVAEEV